MDDVHTPDGHTHAGQQPTVKEGPNSTEENNNSNPTKSPRKGGRLPIGHYSYSAGYSMNQDPRLCAHVGSMMEADVTPVNSFESFLLAEGEKKVTFEIETRVPNAAMFTFNKEDHTLGNLLRAKLVKSPHVLFAAYQVPHPLFAMFKLRVQTDGSLTPKEAVVQACQDLVNELQILDQEFTKEFELKKIAGGAEY